MEIYHQYKLFQMNNRNKNYFLIYSAKVNYPFLSFKLIDNQTRLPKANFYSITNYFSFAMYILRVFLEFRKLSKKNQLVFNVN